MSVSAMTCVPTFGEHQKGRYRLLVLGILALFGPPVFDIQVGFLSVVYSVALVLYAFWALRLTVVFRDDENLGFLLCLFDVALTLPFVLWGAGPTWLAAAGITAWMGGFVVSARIKNSRSRRWVAPAPLMDRASGFNSGHRFSGAVRTEAEMADARGSTFAVVTVRVQRYDELLACHGPEAVDRAVAALSRRSRRELGPDAEGYRLADDLLALIVSARGPVEAAERAGALSKAANGRLIDGRRIDSFVGYAVFPRDGHTARELVEAAERSTPARVADRVAVAGRVAVGGSQAVLG
jgi:GGDEF domain-containing protein